MKFGEIFNSYIKTNNLKLKTLQEDNNIYTRVLFESFLLEAKKAKADLYKDLTINGSKNKVTAEDVASIKFYIKGKSAKDGKTPEEANTINNKQAELFNQIIDKVKESATNNKTTLIELTAAAFSVFKADGQNKPTCGYNLRGVLTVLISQKKLLTPTDGGSVNASNILVDPGDGVVDSEVEPAASTDVPQAAAKEEPQDAAASKFDAALDNNKPKKSADLESSSNTHLAADKAARVDKSEMENRDDRIAANYILDTLKEELPGFFDKNTLYSRTEEENAGMTERDVNVMVDKLVELGKIKYVPKGSSDEGEIVPDRTDGDEAERMDIEDPRDFVDKQISGSTRKGFDFSGFDF
jgi:hypothetical protein